MSSTYHDVLWCAQPLVETTALYYQLFKETSLYFSHFKNGTLGLNLFDLAKMICQVKHLFFGHIVRNMSLFFGRAFLSPNTIQRPLILAPKTPRNSAKDGSYAWNRGFPAHESYGRIFSLLTPLQPEMRMISNTIPPNSMTHPFGQEKVFSKKCCICLMHSTYP